MERRGSVKSTSRDLSTRAVCAGIAIGLAGRVFLSCQDRVIGALLFSLGILAVFAKDYYLFTGRVCYYWQDRERAWDLMKGLLYNCVGALWVGLASISVKDSAKAIMEAHMAMTPMQLFLRSVMCGMCIYLSVEGWKSKGIAQALSILAIMAFVLGGGIHVVAEMFYMVAARSIHYNILFAVAVGNAVGGWILPWMEE